MAQSYDIEVEDVDGMSAPNQKNSFRALAMEQYKRCCTEGSKEMTTGGVMTRTVNGINQEYIVPNQMEIFNNSIDCLKILLFPRIESEGGKYAEDVNQFEKDLKNLDGKFKRLLNKLQSKYDTVIDSINPEASGQKQQAYEEFLRLRQNLMRKYDSRKHLLYKDLLGTLSLLLGEINYMEEQSFIG